jgi:hypothetical protein
MAGPAANWQNEANGKKANVFNATVMNSVYGPPGSGAASATRPGSDLAEPSQKDQ